jgi:hypothetical protein
MAKRSQRKGSGTAGELALIAVGAAHHATTTGSR